MLIEFFLERSRIELAADGLTYRGRVLDLPTIHVTAATPEQCRHKLAAAVTALLTAEAQSLGPAADGNDGERGPSADVARTPLVLSDLDDSTDVALEDSRDSEFTDIVYKKKDWIARLTINRPDAYNAYTDRTLREMAAAFRDAASDNNVAVLVLTGAGERAFSVGGDVQQHREEHLGNTQVVRRWIDALTEAHSALRELGKPSIARINGMVAGGGNDWNLACDLAIAADHAKFVQIETKVGLVSAIGAAHWLPIVVGERRAREIFLTGDPISANKALLWGLVNDVVPYKQLDKVIYALCQKLVDRFPESTRITRDQIGVWKDMAWESITKQARHDLSAYFAGEEAKEGLRALAEKREVNYRGFRANADTRDQSELTRPEGTSLTDSKRRAATRSCYSCGAHGVPEGFEYCGLCGTKLV